MHHNFELSLFWSEKHLFSFEIVLNLVVNGDFSICHIVSRDIYWTFFYFFIFGKKSYLVAIY